jgi:tRNA(Ile)-lysidine synthase TilS/MesJ
MMLHKIRTYIEKYNLLYPEDIVIVGLSGGADSVAL